jgi:hypothetical protein
MFILYFLCAFASLLETIFVFPLRFYVFACRKGGRETTFCIFFAFLRLGEKPHFAFSLRFCIILRNHILHFLCAFASLRETTFYISFAFLRLCEKPHFTFPLRFCVIACRKVGEKPYFAFLYVLLVNTKLSPVNLLKFDCIFLNTILKLVTKVINPFNML